MNSSSWNDLGHATLPSFAIIPLLLKPHRWFLVFVGHTNNHQPEWPVNMTQSTIVLLISHLNNKLQGSGRPECLTNKQNLIASHSWPHMEVLSKFSCIYLVLCLCQETALKLYSQPPKVIELQAITVEDMGIPSHSLLFRLIHMQN